MFGLPLLTLLALAFVIWRVLTYFKKKSPKEQELEKSLEDETIYVEGHGQIRFEDLAEEAAESEIIKKDSDTSKKENL